jgi:6-pyruvoyltetrahydropterin/6-carboxytetrahydropterin synthase
MGDMVLWGTLHTDGGSRGNPGESGIGFYLESNEGTEPVVIARGGWYIGQATNNQAEYQALLWGLQNALALHVRNLTVQADSELMTKQMCGEYRVKDEGLKPLNAAAQALLAGFVTVKFEHVRRAFNSEADTLANQAMDLKAPVGDYATEYLAPTLFSEAQKEPSMADPKGSYTLSVKEHFDAAHSLVGYPGQCANLHGHTWDIEVSVVGSELDEVGIVYDFKTLKSDLLAILEQYDHHYLNEVPPFDGINATAENLARVIYEQLEASLPAGVALVEVAVWESPIARLTYRK